MSYQEVIMRFPIAIFILGCFIFIIGCSSGIDEPIAAVGEAPRISQGTHGLLGLWQFTADPASGSLDVVPLRAGQAHMNVLPFLEPPLLVNLTLESVQFIDNRAEVDIGLRHPFNGLDEFTGFDVCGILITSGSVTGYSDPHLVMAGENDTRLLNPDGFTRWWNPVEFPHDVGTGGYKDGKLGTPDGAANFSATINGYKFFCDALTVPDGPVSGAGADSRCFFSAGKKNIRHYSIELNAGLVFNYAVDANWSFPTGAPPYIVPDSFGPEANRPEPWNAVVTETENTLWNNGVSNGGGLSLEIEVWDHYTPDLDNVYLESPGNFDKTGPLTLDEVNPGYAIFSADITDATPAEGSINILVIVECEKSGYYGTLPGKPISSYFVHTASVDDKEPVQTGKNMPLREGVDAMDIAVDHADGDLLVLYSDGAVWKYTEAGGYQDGAESYLTYEPGIQYIDIAPNSVSVVGGFWMNEADVMKVYDSAGALISNVNIGSGACWAHDVVGFTGHTYTNMAGILSGTCPMGTYLRWRFYPPPDYQSGYWYANLTFACGPNSIHRDTVVGTEAGNISMYYVYYLEGAASGCNEYRVQRLYRASGTDITNDPTVSWGGVQSDGMDGFWDPKDITRDVDNDFYILDQLSNGEPAIKKYTEEGDPVGEPFGDSTSISGTPLRIEGSDYEGLDGNLLFVLHDNDPADMISIFYPDEIPD